MPNVGEWPRVYVLGCQKGATTSLAVTLDTSGGMQHSRRSQESRFWFRLLDVQSNERRWGRHEDLDLKWAGTYPNQFQPAIPAYDADPDQLLNEGMPAALALVMPHELHARVRLIAVLREPTSRLLSWYNHRIGAQVKGYCEYCGFCGNVWGKPTPDDAAWTPSFVDDAACEARETGGVNYRRGLYAPQLQRWRAAWPRKQLLVLSFSELVARPEEYVDRVIRGFTGLPQLHGLPHVNSMSSRFKVRRMCCESYCDLLRAGYAQDARRLYEMLDADYEARLGPELEPRFAHFAPPSCEVCEVAGGGLKLGSDSATNVEACSVAEGWRERSGVTRDPASQQVGGANASSSAEPAPRQQGEPAPYDQPTRSPPPPPNTQNGGAPASDAGTAPAAAAERPSEQAASPAEREAGGGDDPRLGRLRRVIELGLLALVSGWGARSILQRDDWRGARTKLRSAAGYLKGRFTLIREAGHRLHRTRVPTETESVIEQEI